MLRLPEQYNWYNDRQKRIGGRCAILAKLDVHGREVGVASIHLENRTDGEGRRVQMQAVLDEVQRVFAGLPVILGGDLNTNTFDGRDKDYIRLTRRKPVGEGNFLAMRLDWIIPRGFTAKDSRVISTVTADIDFAKEGGALARFAEPELSDHNVVWASLQLHK